ncbi:Uncharacterized protein TPAR_08331 [Tolypocladium paradoxum]|uniref:Uncharacterized protein n=1 Tax=Tolypocladium paradoxum TaxID=94208 RepID=A0A2S4KMP0_9HYPO|nr:Uncharacterized protein TPAR_08331 [Tolypocladium paradoxum]
MLHRQTTRNDTDKMESLPTSRGREQTRAPKRLTHADYAVGWVTALPLELAAAQTMLDEIHDSLPQEPNDSNTYTLGRIGRHNLVMACLPAGKYGTTGAAVVASNMRRSFRFIQVGLMVGIGGGVPGRVDIRLGDVVVGSGVVQYDYGKTVPPGRIYRTGNTREPPENIATAVAKLQAIYETHPSRISTILSRVLERHQDMSEYTCPGSSQDLLFESAYDHPSSMHTCDACDEEKLQKRPARLHHGPKVHRGKVASANQVMRYGTARDQLADELGVLCFEMEAAGLMDIFPCLVIRGICDYSDSHKNKQWQRYSAIVVAAYAKDLLSVMPTRAFSKTPMPVRSGANERTLDRREKRLDSLKYDRLNSRYGDIEAAQYETCEWLLSHQDYMDWQDPTKLGQHHGLFWISGKPGSGKSTLMKFAYTQKAKEPATNAITTSFFFNASGTELEKTTIGMHRSLLLQLLEKIPDLQEVLDDPGGASYNEDSIEWTIGALRYVFSAAVAKLGSRRLTCIIDALDECDETLVRSMVTYFEDVAQRAVSSGTQLRVCFSSRHYPHISLRRGLQLILQDQSGHKEDIEMYVRKNLKHDEGEYIENILAEILRKAGGVFMWVVLVVGILNKEIDRGHMLRVERRLQQIPQELSALFRDILTRDNENMAEALLSLQWILYARRPLRPEEFYFAVGSGPNPEPGIFTEWNPRHLTPKAMDRIVVSSSKGLAEVSKSTDRSVQFIHESVRDFLVKEKGLHELWSELGENFESLSHDRLKQCCGSYLMVDISQHLADNETCLDTPTRTGEAWRLQISRRFPFLRYATHNVLHHADVAAVNQPQDSFLEEFPLKHWIKLDNLFETNSSRRHTPKASLLYILAERNGMRLLKSLPWPHPDMHVSGEIYQYPLFAALAHGHRDAASFLLQQDTGLSIDNFPGLQDGEPDFMPRSLLLWAAGIGDVSTVKLLLEMYNVGINSKNADKRTPLSVAAEHGHEALVRLLLATNAVDVDGIDIWRRTPLSYAAERGHEAIVQLLLATRAANVNFKDALGRAPLTYAAEEGHSAVVQLLLATTVVNVDSKDYSGWTSLSYAVRRGHEAIVQLLLATNAVNVDSKDHWGQTLLSFAARHGHEAVVQLLLATNNVNVNSKDYNNRTPLSHAAKGGHQAVVRLLLATNAVDVNSKDRLDRTPLPYAAEEGHEAIVQLLLATPSIDIMKESDSGRSPILYAVRKKHWTTVGRLRLAIDAMNDNPATSSQGNDDDDAGS